MAIAAGKPSRTAVLTAAARALHLEEPPPWVLEDRLALSLAGPEGEAARDAIQQRLAPAALQSFSRWVCVRARYPEDLVESALAEGIRQYAILGAGLDSFAYRRADLLERLRTFEVDHPASQHWKRARLAELRIDVPRNLMYAPVDFEHQTLRGGLETSGFEFGSPAVFSWIGVTMYLTLDAIRATLGTVASCASPTRIVLTYNRPPSALTGVGRTIESTLREVVGEMGEPMITVFEPDEIEAVLREEGFHEIVHFGPEEALATYFPGRTDVRLGGAQRLVVATAAG